MSNKKSILAATRRVGADDPMSAQVRIAAPLLLRCQDLIAELDHEPVSFSSEDVRQALLGQTVLLKRAGQTLAEADFARVARELTAVYLELAELPPERAAACRELDWRALFETIDRPHAGTDPGALIGAARKAAGEELAGFIELIVTLTLRTLLGRAIRDAETAIAEDQSDTIHLERPLRCPICGGEPGIASVCPSRHHGNEKRLWCSCCGASWPFERIRCALCGGADVSDLRYVHDENDETRRLHVCRRCGQSFPTVCLSNIEDFDPDIDALAITGLVSYWEERHAGGAGHAEGDDASR